MEPVALKNLLPLLAAAAAAAAAAAGAEGARRRRPRKRADRIQNQSVERVVNTAEEKRQDRPYKRRSTRVSCVNVITIGKSSRAKTDHKKDEKTE